MDLKFKRKNKTLIILVAGEIDHHSSKELRSKTESALEQMGGRNIIFGFQEVTFMDSAGIGVMIGRYKQVQSLGGRIAIACPNEKNRGNDSAFGTISFVAVLCFSGCGDCLCGGEEIGCSMKMKHGYFLPRNQKMRALPVYLPQAF